MATDQFARKPMVGLSVRRWVLGVVQIHLMSELDRRLMTVTAARTLFGQGRAERSQRGYPRSRNPQNPLLFQERMRTVCRKAGQILSNQMSAGKVFQGHRDQWKVG